jgi:sugar lactone lactonase YvrE
MSAFFQSILLRPVTVLPTLALLVVGSTAGAQLQAVPAVTDDAQVPFSLNNLTTGPTALVGPGGVAVSSDGTVYVTDSGAHGTANGRVVRITPASQVSGTTAVIAGTAAVLGVTVTTPNAVVVDSLGNLYIADIGGHQVLKVTNPETTPTAAAVSYGTGQENPTALAVDSSNNLYIADAGQNAVFVAGTTTKLASGQTGPVGLAVDSAGNVYFADKSDVVFKYTKSTALRSQLLTGFSFASAPTNVPIGMGFDPAGNLYILDSGAGKLHEYNPSATANTTQIPFSNITTAGSLAVSTAGNIFLSNHSGNAVDELFYNNNPVNFGAIAAATNSAKVTVNDYFSVAESNVAFYESVLGDSTGEFVAPGTNPCLNTPKNNPTGVTAGTQCSFQFYVNYLSNTPGLRRGVFGLTDANKDIFAIPAIGISQIGRLALYPGNQTILTPPAGGFFEPQGLAITGNSGTLFVADEGGNLSVTPPTFNNGAVYQYAQGTGSPTKVGPTFPLWSAPTSLALNSAGNLYVADYNGTVTVVPSPWTGAGANLTFPTGATLTHPMALAFDPSGDLYIGDMGPGGVSATAQNPGYIIKVPANGGPAVKLNYQVSGVPVVFPQALVTDTAGNLYIADGGDGSTDMGGLVVVPVNGTAPFLLPSDGYQPFGAGLSQPAGLSFDAAGDLYVLDGYNQRVLVFPITYNASGTPTLTNADITPLGQTTAQAGSSGITATLVTPTSLVVWPAGQNVTVTDIGFQGTGQGATYPTQVVSLDSTNTTLNAPANSSASAMGVNTGNEVMNFTNPTTTGDTFAFTLSVCGSNNTSVSTSVVSPCFPAIKNNNLYQNPTEDFYLANNGAYAGSYIKATGQVQAPDAVLTGPEFSFSQTVTVTLTNQGLATLNIYNINVTGSASLSGGTCGATLAGGASCTILMTFNNGVFFTTGTVTVTDNSGGVTLPTTATQSVSTFFLFSF